MQLCMFLSLFNSPIGRSTIFGLALASAALPEVGQWGGLSSHIFPGMYITVGYLSYCGFVSFYRVIFQHIGLSEKSWGLCSVLEVSTIDFWYPTFSGGSSEFYGKLSDSFHVIWIVCTILSPQGIRSCHQVFDHSTACLAEFLWALAHHLVPGFSGGVSKVLFRTGLLL